MEKQKNKPRSSFNNKEFLLLEEKFARQHRNDTDEELITYLNDIALKLGHIPKKHEVFGFTYLKSRFGPWPRVLEKAGLKKAHPKTVRRNKNKK
jgi:hypothetical protein